MSNDFCFFFMELSIQYLMLDTFPVQHTAQKFRSLNGNCTYQYRLLFFMSLFLCCLWCAGMAVWGWRRRISVRRKTVPFLPFVLPAVLWILRG